MTRRIAFVVVCVVLSWGTSSGAQGATALEFRRGTGTTTCNYSVPEMCRGTAWSADPSTGAYDAHAVINGVHSAQIDPDAEFDAAATAKLGRTYDLPQAVPDVRVSVAIEPRFGELTDEPGAVGGSAGYEISVSMEGTHVDAASTGATCTVARDGWRRDGWINGYEEFPGPEFVLTGVITCRDANAQPVDVPPGSIQIVFTAFAGVRATGLCLFSFGPGCLNDAPPELETNETRMRGTATLSVDHAGA